VVYFCDVSIIYQAWLQLFGSPVALIATMDEQAEAIPMVLTGLGRLLVGD